MAFVYPRDLNTIIYTYLDCEVPCLQQGTENSIIPLGPKFISGFSESMHGRMEDTRNSTSQPNRFGAQSKAAKCVGEYIRYQTSDHTRKVME